MGKRGPPSTGTRNKSTKKPDPRHYRKTTRWAVDMDYTRKLSPEHAAWMAQFCDEYYACDFRYEEPLHADVQAKRERYRAQNRNWADAMSRSSAAGMLNYDVPAQGPDLAADHRPTPEYQRETEYQMRLKEYRAIVDVPATQRTELQRKRLQLLQDYLLNIAASETGVENED